MERGETSPPEEEIRGQDGRTDDDSDGERLETRVRGGDRFFDEVREERIVQYLDLKFAQARYENNALQRRLDRQEQTPKFNKKRHERQFSFNLDILDGLETVAGLLEQGRVTKSKSIVGETGRWATATCSPNYLTGL